MLLRLSIFLLFLTNVVYGQDTLISSTLKEVVITSYFKPEEQFYQPASSVVIDSLSLNNSRDKSLLNLANLKPGIRMEERSPGSYRFSIRGSLLRSPFGIRNVKFYFNEFPLTDAGGNTYLNLFDHSLFSGIEILKGPDGSIFGANSGGVVKMIHSPSDDTISVKLRINSGSYGEVYESVRTDLTLKKHQITFFESYRRNDGYRMNSAIRNFNVMIYDRINLSEKLSFDVFGFISNLYYRTPGGLTILQANDDPQQSRPATPFLPSAREQEARIENQTGWLGAQLKYKINQRFTFLAALSSLHTRFENPFITNYETRKEAGANGRIWLMAENKNVNLIRYKFVAGIEGAILNSTIKNSENISGESGILLASDKIINDYLVIFSSATAFVGNKITAQASLSENLNSVSINGTFPGTGIQKINYSPQLMPKFSISYSPKYFLLIRGVVSKGYSVPTTAEVRPSGNKINTSLNPESGWNYEAGLRIKTKNRFFYTDISIFKYDLSNTISRRIDENETEFFINSGNTSQKGIEVQTNFDIPFSDQGPVSLNIENAITLYDFRFVNFISGETDLTNKRLTGIPDQAISSTIALTKKDRWSLSLTHYFTGSIPLNDLSTDVAPENNLFQLKIEKKFRGKKFLWSVFTKIENVTNVFYSSGYDLNAFSGRYYNPAARRNFTAGIFIESQFKQ